MTDLNTAAETFAVIDTLHRFAAGIDLKDPALLASAFTANAVSDFRPAAAKAGFEYPVLEGRDTIVGALSGALSQLDTTHSVSNGVPRSSRHLCPVQPDAYRHAFADRRRGRAHLSRVQPQ